MYEITLAEHPFQLTSMDFRGSPTGIDVTGVLATGIVPAVNTGMAGRIAGTGQVGAGLVESSMACFEQAVVALANATVDPVMVSP